jgi:Alw26I/Eco31I/Esp3I family type II restriction m6 adenine DNA methyltransferase
MEHLSVIRQSKNYEKGAALLQTKASGEYFTPEIVGRRLAQDVLSMFKKDLCSSLRVIDPFCGDGRLLVWLLEEMVVFTPRLRDLRWDLYLWDISPHNVSMAVDKVTSTVSRIGIKATVNASICDSFEEALVFKRCFDIVITNPPWELIKPDKRDLHYLTCDEAVEYTENLKKLSDRLSRNYPFSVPSRSFSGWGLNLSRVGFDASIHLLAQQGIAGIVMPVSFLGDQTSIKLRQWFFEGTQCRLISVYPAEARLFDGVDQSFSTIVSEAGFPQETLPQTKITSYDQKLDISEAPMINLREDWIRRAGYCVPISLSESHISTLKIIQSHPRLADLEGVNQGELWIGREVDETNLSSFTDHIGEVRFLKGKHIESYQVKEDIDPVLYVNLDRLGRLPSSTHFARLIWRDVSRPNQKRRMHVTVIPAGYVTGNSLNVMHEWRQDVGRLPWFLAMTNSLAFEFQVRTFLKTGHISAGIVRRSAVPLPEQSPFFQRVVTLVMERLQGNETVDASLEVMAAQSYGLDRDSFSALLERFPKLSGVEKKSLLDKNLWKSVNL